MWAWRRYLTYGGYYFVVGYFVVAVNPRSTHAFVPEFFDVPILGRYGGYAR